MGWLNLTMANQTIKNDLKAKKITLPQFFILQNFIKILRADPQLWWWAIFGSRKAQFVLNKLFLSTNHCNYFHLPIGPFHCAKFFLWIQSYVDDNFWVQNGPFPKMIIFSENLLMSLVSFIHAFVHAKSQSQILIYKWNVDVERILKSHWPRSIFGYNLRTRFFPSMQFLQNVNEP